MEEYSRQYTNGRSRYHKLVNSLEKIVAIYITVSFIIYFFKTKPVKAIP